MRFINFRAGLKRIWIVFSALYLACILFAWVVSDCTGYFDRSREAIDVWERNVPKKNRLMDMLPISLQEDMGYGFMHGSLLRKIEPNLFSSDLEIKEREQIRKKFSNITDKIRVLESEVWNARSSVGSCERIFQWQWWDDMRYANLGTLIGTMLGGLVLLWTMLYILIGLGGGLVWLVVWIKDDFTEEVISRENDIELDEKNAAPFEAPTQESPALPAIKNIIKAIAGIIFFVLFIVIFFALTMGVSKSIESQMKPYISKLFGKIS